MPNTRTRSLPAPSGKGRFTRVDTVKATGVSNVITDVSADLASSLPKGTQVTVSENHPAWNTRKGRSMSDIGGDFSSVRTSVDWKPKGNHRITVREETATVVRVHTYSGPVVATASGLAFPSSIASNNIALDGWGAKAVASAKPTNALVDLSTSLGELLGPGGIPRAIGRAAFWHEGIKNAIKSSADDFLNVQFSLTPIVQDMVGFAHVVDRFNALVKQYERDAGKVVRRRWNFEPITAESSVLVASDQVPAMAPNSTVPAATFGGLRQVYRRNSSSIRRWFSGAFTYHLPSGYSSRNKMLSFGPEAQKLIGLEPTPETLWNLAPWSWAVDWFTSAGDVISNISDWSSDGLVMRYGYLMEHSVSQSTYYWSGTSSKGVWPAPITLTRESKVRRRANPFGFGLTWNGLSPRQLAIAASLGISRAT